MKMIEIKPSEGINRKNNWIYLLIVFLSIGIGIVYNILRDENDRNKTIRRSQEKECFMPFNYISFNRHRNIRLCVL